MDPEPPKSQLRMKKKSTGKHIPTSWKIAPPWQDPPAKVICQIDYFEVWSFLWEALSIRLEEEEDEKEDEDFIVTRLACQDDLLSVLFTCLPLGWSVEPVGRGKWRDRGFYQDNVIHQVDCFLTWPKVWSSPWEVLSNQLEEESEDVEDSTMTVWSSRLIVSNLPEV